ncbi:hypothetical protein M0R45_034498 [Rubus argutus]|uniref:B3 domain-containing protein n=1 Tax=Rubus argutus TaxID=59490 RepID=A0AAW1VU01_RUBAR
MGSLSTETLEDKKYCEGWSGFYMLVEVCCDVSEEEKMGTCMLSLVREQEQVCPKKQRSSPSGKIPKMTTSPNPSPANIVSGSSDQGNRRIDNKGLRRKRKPCGDDKDSEVKKKKRKYMTRVDKGVYHPPPDLPEEYKRLMANGAKAELVIQKQLFTSDVNCDLNRVSLPPKQVLCKNFLRPNEIENLKPKDAFLKVPFIDPMLEKEEMSLSLWKLSSSAEKSAVLNSNWNHIVKKNGLIAGDLIQIWSFRDTNDQLQLALVVLKRAEKPKKGEEASSTARSSRVCNGSEDSASTSHIGRKCLKIRFKCSGSRSESTSTSELLSQ